MFSSEMVKQYIFTSLLFSFSYLWVLKKLIICSLEFRGSKLLSTHKLLLERGKVPENFFKVFQKTVIKAKVFRVV